MSCGDVWASVSVSLFYAILFDCPDKHADLKFTQKYLMSVNVPISMCADSEWCLGTSV